MLKKIIEKNTAEGWKEITLGDLVTFQRGHDLPSTKRIIGKYPVVASSGIDGYHNEFKAMGPGVVIGRSGKLGIVQLIEEDYWPLNTTLYSKEFHDADPKFVFFFLKTLNLETFNSGSAVPTLNRNFIHPLKIKIPSIKIQNKIGSILYDFDKQIKILRKQNTILEKIVQSIFKSWFVDFDGQREFVDSELGQIPKGWKIVKLQEILSLLKDGSHNPPKRAESGIKFIAGASDLKHFEVDFSKCTYITKDDFDKIHKYWSINPNDVLLTIVGTIGNTGIVKKSDVPFSLQRSIAVLRANEKADFIFLYCLLNTIEFRQFLNANVNPTGQPGIYLGILSRFEFILPPKTLIEEFSKIAHIIITSIQNDNSRIMTLSKIQDIFLPKLMSGDIKVKV